MPVRGLILPIKRSSRLDPLGEYYRRCFYHNLDFDLRTGRAMTTLNNDKIISVAETYRMVAQARAEGWLPPPSYNLGRSSETSSCYNQTGDGGSALHDTQYQRE
jgi:hypothetical protein